LNLHSIATHTVDLDLLPEVPRVLDAGCRDFDFTRGILELRPKAAILAIDADPDLPSPPPELARNIAVLRLALVGDSRERARYFRGSTGHGNFLSDLDRYYDMQPVEVACVNMNDLLWGARTEQAGPRFIDLVKLDIEGSEFQVLERWPGPVAKQISVEFHDWDKPQYDKVYYHDLFGMLGKFGYRVVQHELSIQGTGCGHWDTLIVLDR
jgi:FkbM family methyltransferase